MVEKELVCAMLSEAPKAENLLSALETRRVADMSDGGMGSIRFIADTEENRLLGHPIATAECLDSDNVVISIAITVDNRGDLYEIDLWKVDFSPLRSYPRPGNLRNIVMQ